jgi:hypothetical protein
VLVTACCCWLAYQANFARQRKATLREIERIGGSYQVDASKDLPMTRQMLGDVVPTKIEIPMRTESERWNWGWRMRQEFPEIWYQNIDAIDPPDEEK